MNYLDCSVNLIFGGNFFLISEIVSNMILECKARTKLLTILRRGNYLLLKGTISTG